MQDNPIQLNSISDAKVLLRVAYDVADLNSTFRIINSFNTIEKLLKNNNTVIIITHWGRPKAREQSHSINRMIPTIARLMYEHLGVSKDIICFSNQFESSLQEINEIIETNRNLIHILENVRFDTRETSSDENQKVSMAVDYSRLADYFVDEAFALSHRKHATNYCIKDHLQYAYGLSYGEETRQLTSIAKSPQTPLVVISGGAKLETKIPVLNKLAYRADSILVGGKICFTLLKARGDEVPGGYVDERLLDQAETLINSFGDKLILPVDFVFSDKDSEGRVYPYDIGPNTVNMFRQSIMNARSLFWNGPLGYYEQGYVDGTIAIAQEIRRNQNCYSVVGGGDIISSLPQELLTSFDFVSAGGGATLAYLAQRS